MPITTLRLDDKELRRIRDLARKTRRDKSAVARELLDYGWQLHLLKLYRAGKISLGYLAKELEVTVSEAMDVLVEMGIPANVTLSDVIAGSETLRRLSSKRGSQREVT